jgi:hypothetical protein
MIEIERKFKVLSEDFKKPFLKKKLSRAGIL